MHWIYNYQLFLFDFDGILVNTEHLHHLAYKKMCAKRGFSLNWDLATYARHAWFSAEGLKQSIYKQFPDLYRVEPNWDVLYDETKQAYMELLLNQGVDLMPGVEKLLALLEKASIKRCVVTHSPKKQIAIIQKMHPILNSIPNWITREDYVHPKPSPEGYQKAIDALSAKGDRIIGFEDSPRGLKALLQTKAEAVFVSNIFSEDEVRQFVSDLKKDFAVRSSFLS